MRFGLFSFFQGVELGGLPGFNAHPYILVVMGHQLEYL